MSEQLRQLADQLRTQLATIQKNIDEIGRDVRIATHHGETVMRDFLWLDHARKSLSAALVSAFDEMEKLDVLILAATNAAASEPPPPGGDKCPTT